MERSKKRKKMKRKAEEVGKKAEKHDCTKKEILLLFQEWDLILFSAHSSQNIIPISLWSSLADGCMPLELLSRTPLI